jgi:hypothetical protein
MLLDQSVLAKDLDRLIHCFGFSNSAFSCDPSTGRIGDARFGIDVHTDTAVDGNVTGLQPVGEDAVIDEKKIFAFFFHGN